MKAVALAILLTLGTPLACLAQESLEEVEFEGVIQRLPAHQILGIWIVSDKVVIVPEGVVIEEDDGPIGVGAKVEVEGFIHPDGSIVARKIETDQ